MGCIVYQTNKKTGVVYAYWNETHRDPVTKKPKSQRTYMGRVDPETHAIIEKASDGKRNRSPIGTGPDENVIAPEAANRISELQQQVSKLNQTVSELTDHIKRTDAVLKKIGDLANSIPGYDFNSK